MSRTLEARKKELSEKTGYTSAEVDKLIARYRLLDKSKDMTDGITLGDMMTIPEFAGYPFMYDIIRMSVKDSSTAQHTNKGEGNKSKDKNNAAKSNAAGGGKDKGLTQDSKKSKNGSDRISEDEENSIRLYMEDFVKLAWKLSSRASDNVKQNLAWSVVNFWNADVLRPAEMFRVYRRIMAGSLTDDQCLEMAYHALNLPQLARKGEMTRDEFFDFVPPYEIRLKFTIDLQMTL